MSVVYGGLKEGEARMLAVPEMIWTRETGEEEGPEGRLEVRNLSRAGGGGRPSSITVSIPDQ